MIRKTIAILSVGIGSFCLAQNGANVYPFLNLPVSARQAALGGDAITVRDHDVNFAMVNPSLLHQAMENRLSVNYAAFLADTKYGTISYAKDLGNGHLIAAHARYMDYGSMPRTDAFAEVNGEFSAMDASLGIGYAYQFEDDWTIGGNIGVVSSRIDHYTSAAITGTGALTYHVQKQKETVALVVRNFGYQIKTYNGEREKLPFRIDLGYTKILEHIPLAISVTAHNLQRFNISSEYDNTGQKTKFGRKLMDHFSIGAELFPEESFNLRLGYNVKRGTELAIVDQRSFAGLSAGFGIKIASFRFDYAHVRYHSASNVNMIGLTMDLTELSGYRR
ncbi:type IX secretion system protein PorQ [Bergeyella sp. RCAD1439]|uniref:type IX secretion system protein PorQ n=1 Tax=Bergeyella anatis TaxID=3113737 RepID=UPI002E19CEB5|nr:type IX secretion system protein PorQ [Bergeyella sp. RCAD1439]